VNKSNKSNKPQKQESEIELKERLEEELSSLNPILNLDNYYLVNEVN